MTARTGFLARAFLPIGPLVVSRGFGGSAEEEGAAVVEAELLPLGKEFNVAVVAQRRAPTMQAVVQQTATICTCPPQSVMVLCRPPVVAAAQLPDVPLQPCRPTSSMGLSSAPTVTAYSARENTPLGAAARSSMATCCAPRAVLTRS